MDTELRKMVSIPMVGAVDHNVSIRDSNKDNSIKYTSLRDIIPQSPTNKGVIPNQDHNLIDSANISISNQLVKQAASAYLQSAAILATRNEDCLASLWEDATRPTVFHSIWRVYVVKPLKACIGFVVRPICRIAAYLANRICL